MFFFYYVACERDSWCIGFFGTFGGGGDDDGDDDGLFILFKHTPFIIIIFPESKFTSRSRPVWNPSSYFNIFEGAIKKGEEGRRTWVYT